MATSSNPLKLTVDPVALSPSGGSAGAQPAPPMQRLPAPAATFGVPPTTTSRPPHAPPSGRPSFATTSRNEPIVLSAASIPPSCAGGVHIQPGPRIPYVSQRDSRGVNGAWSGGGYQSVVPERSMMHPQPPKRKVHDVPLEMVSAEKRVRGMAPVGLPDMRARVPPPIMVNNFEQLGMQQGTRPVAPARNGDVQSSNIIPTYPPPSSTHTINSFAPGFTQQPVPTYSGTRSATWGDAPAESMDIIPDQTRPNARQPSVIVTGATSRPQSRAPTAMAMRRQGNLPERIYTSLSVPAKRGHGGSDTDGETSPLSPVSSQCSTLPPSPRKGGAKEVEVIVISDDEDGVVMDTAGSVASANTATQQPEAKSKPPKPKSHPKPKSSRSIQPDPERVGAETPSAEEIAEEGQPFWSSTSASAEASDKGPDVGIGGSGEAGKKKGKKKEVLFYVG
ncbi:hypothetical protein HK097_007464 [Rhizophlyctis rosea]|uniref:Uncharacterized protein n=1 Tax=Rhizophlyctis rosea TaxID=64517 RepID=A0AAD5SBI0_9FUNG|nr:hypothetical protein HK097_007464 [Rhizophlyctis rosea]